MSRPPGAGAQVPGRHPQAEARPGLDPPQEEHTASAWGGWGVGMLCRSVRPGQGAHIRGRAPAQDPKRSLLRGRLGSESTMRRPLSQPGPGASCPPHSDRPEPPCPVPPTRPAGLSDSAAGRGSPSAFPPGLPAPAPTAGPGCWGLSEGLAGTCGGGADAQEGRSGQKFEGCRVDAGSGEGGATFGGQGGKLSPRSSLGRGQPGHSCQKAVQSWERAWPGCASATCPLSFGFVCF